MLPDIDTQIALDKIGRRLFAAGITTVTTGGRSWVHHGNGFIFYGVWYVDDLIDEKKALVLNLYMTLEITAEEAFVESVVDRKIAELIERSVALLENTKRACVEQIDAHLEKIRPLQIIQQGIHKNLRAQDKGAPRVGK